MSLTYLASAVWWKAALLRALSTAVAVAVPYLGGSLLADVPWVTIVSAGVLGALASLVTSLAGLPEVEGATLPWWQSAAERAVKTFAQALAAGFVGATLLTDVAWSTVLQAAALSTLVTLLRYVLATLPSDGAILEAGVTGDGAAVVTAVSLPRPADDALKPEWVAYATGLGVDATGLTKAEIIDAVSKLAAVPA